MDPNPPRQLVLGTAGHIDHGKTSLIRALTGIDCDRLPEEKSRGITIDLGFARLPLGDVEFGVVDVPGHERFVHNMVAGATGIDVALLVIACDDSIMPQTIEHLAILQILGVERGVIALTKRDLVDDEHAALVEAEVEDLVAGTFLQGAPVVPVSSTTGQGLDALREALATVAQTPAAPEAESHFRLPIDRVFTQQGHGAVVTGTVWSGRTRVGDTLSLWPGPRDVRVRRLQSHGRDVDVISAGQRAAINLAGVKSDEIWRGDELGTPGSLSTTRRLLVKLQVLATASRPLLRRRLVRLHTAARESTARVLFDRPELAPGESAYAVLLCQTPVIAEYGQRFVIRRLSPVITIGGGVVLAPQPGNVRMKTLLRVAASLDTSDEQERIVAWLAMRGCDSLAPADLAGQLGIHEDRAEPLVSSLVAAKRICRLQAGGARTFIDPDYRAALEQRLVNRVARELERRRPARFVPIAPILTSAERAMPKPVAEELLSGLVAQGRLIRRDDRIGDAGRLPQLTHRQREQLEALVGDCVSGGIAPPTLKECAQQIKLSRKELEPLVQVAVDTGQLLRVNADLAIAPAAVGELRDSLQQVLANSGPATVAELRDHWKLTRKHAIPYLEWFDELGVTQRAGDVRTLGPRAQLPLEELLP